MSALWPWLVLAGLGAFHGINPAMGWLFAAALGMHRHSQAVVVASLVPIAFGHALSITVVVAAVLLVGWVVDAALLRHLAGVVLIGWAAYHWLYGARHKVRVGMTAGFAGLALWSFLMASAHGAGLMLIPVVLPLCLAASPSGELTTAALPIAAAAVAVHSLAMLAVTGTIAIVVYRWVGVDFLHRGWINLDLLWSIALVLTGLLLLLV
ncbi:MAG: hypothetical protein AAF637_04095 [Pseudomonadota bacterium]